jgi:hypothetical protein
LTAFGLKPNALARHNIYNIRPDERRFDGMTLNPPRGDSNILKT